MTGFGVEKKNRTFVKVGEKKIYFLHIWARKGLLINWASMSSCSQLHGLLHSKKKVAWPPLLRPAERFFRRASCSWCMANWRRMAARRPKNFSPASPPLPSEIWDPFSQYICRTELGEEREREHAQTSRSRGSRSTVARSFVGERPATATLDRKPRRPETQTIDPSSAVQIR